MEKNTSKNIPHVKREGREPQVKIPFVSQALFGMSLVTTAPLIAAVTKLEFRVPVGVSAVVTGTQRSKDFGWFMCTIHK
jgi:ABC-type enterobactin transport system permease subunit